MNQKSLYRNAFRDLLAGGVRGITDLYRRYVVCLTNGVIPQTSAQKQYGAFEDPLVPVYPWAASPDRI